MKFSDTVDAAKALLQRKGRITHRALAREFGLDDGALRDLVDELVHAERVAVDEGGRVLAWIAPASGDRRQLSVMFCDLVGSTALSERLDPEDLHRLVTAYQHAVGAVLNRYEGHVAQYLGDGILAYFGYPAAHEDDAARAVQAGLEILTAVDGLKLAVPLQVRLGVHTGLVVIGTVGEGERSEQLALGRTPNIAARLQGEAPPQSLVISAATHRLVQGLFDCRDLGAHVLKGIAEPMTLYEVTRAGHGPRNRSDVRLQQGLTPMHGRHADLQQLLLRWSLAASGQGQLALIGGDPGIGKSRLLQALAQHGVGHGAQVLSLRCSAFHANSPLFPLIDHLDRQLRDAPDPAPPRQRLQRLLAAAGLDDARTLALFAHLLSLPPADGEPALGREERRQLTQQALVDWVLRLTLQRPVLLVLEDLHWADPSTVAWLGALIERLPLAALMLGLSLRPGFEIPWPAAPNHLSIALPRLSVADTQRLATDIVGRPLADDVVKLLVSKTDGVPLYVEEMTKDLLESHLLREHNGTMRLSRILQTLGVPFSLQDSLTSRLDRLGPARHIAELAAVLGREFEQAWIAALHEGDAAVLASGLQTLCEADILLREGEGPATRYSFRHALLRDAAYNALLIRRRQQLHARFVALLESHWPDTVRAQPELVAHHATEAGLAELAVGHWQRAGLQAVERSANAEAIRHFSAALEILRTLPAGDRRDRQELALLLSLGVPLSVTTSWAAPEVRWAHERALDLCQRLGESSQMFPALYGVWSNRQVQADFRAARPLSDQLMTLAAQTGDDGCRLQAHRAHAIVQLHTGDFAAALRHCEAGHALYDPRRHHAQVAQFWVDPGVGCLSYGAWALVCMGRQDEALRRAQQSLELARAGGHDFSLAYALHFVTTVHQTRRETEATRLHAQALLELSRARGFPAFQAWGSLLMGCAMAEEGRAAEGSALIRHGHAATQSAGARVARSAALAALATLYERAGETDRGLEIVAEALAFVAESEEHFYEAELLRVRGDLRLHPPARPDLARQDYADALALARRQQAWTWALRAALRLARLQHADGDAAAARATLAAVQPHCTEGRDTPDQQEAAALAHALNGRVGSAPA